MAAIADHRSAHLDWRQEKHEARRPLEAKEAQEAEARARRAMQARRQAEQQLAANNSKAWCDRVGQRVVEHLKRDRDDLYDILGEVVAKERAAVRKEIKAGVADDAKLAALERRILQHLENHTDSVITASSFLPGALKRLASHEGRTNRPAQRNCSIGATPQISAGKFPTAKTWRSESVTYQNEFVCYDGALYQARRDTAQTPGGIDWSCVARAGRDELTPNICSTYDTRKTYEQLDIVAQDDAGFIASQGDRDSARP